MSEHPTTPIYNIKAAVKLTDVPACTLRSWESRYGIVKPARHPNGYRLYSQHDITKIIWLRDKLKEGLSIAQASALMQQAQQDEPEMAPAPAQSIEPTRPESRVRSLETLSRELFQAFITYDEGQAERIINEAFSLYSFDQVCLGMFEPVMYEIGERWSRGEVSIQTEHFATSIMRTRLGSYMQSNLSTNGFLGNRPLIVTGCGPLEDHELGVLMVSLFLRRLNYRVIYLGQNVADEQLRATLLKLRPALVCFSASTQEAAENLRAVSEIVRELREENKLNIHFAFGGRVFKEVAELRQTLNGVYLGDNAHDAAHIVHDMLR